MDGCNNLPYRATARTKIGAGYAGPMDVTPRADNSMGGVLFVFTD